MPAYGIAAEEDRLALVDQSNDDATGVPFLTFVLDVPASWRLVKATYHLDKDLAKAVSRARRVFEVGQVDVDAILILLLRSDRSIGVSPGGGASSVSVGTSSTTSDPTAAMISLKMAFSFMSSSASMESRILLRSSISSPCSASELVGAGLIPNIVKSALHSGHCSVPIATCVSHMGQIPSPDSPSATLVHFQRWAVNNSQISFEKS